jgi:kynurenine formamidase
MTDNDAAPRRNWGRWGPDDELGALNLVTPERTVDAAGLVTEGRVFSLARQIRHDTVRVQERTGPVHVLTLDAGDYAVGARAPGGVFTADDFISMPLATGTHIDALAHIWGDDGLYNGHDPRQVRSHGARACGIDKVAGIVTGGLCADIPSLYGGEPLGPSHVVTPEEIEAALGDAAGDLRPGDALLVRTGWLDPENVAKVGPQAVAAEEPGVGAAAVEWVADRDVAVLGADTLGVEVLPGEGGHPGSPLHVELLTNLGVHLIEMLDLDALAAIGPRRFLFMVAPLPIRGAVNSPINPLAVI